MPNQKVINGLSNSNKVTDVYAYLQDKEGKNVFTFLYNPESKRFSRESNYDPGITALTTTPSQQYKYTSGLTLRLNDLILESYSVGKNCKLLLQQLQELMITDPTQAKFSPTPVYFIWGIDKFGPAVITSLQWTETAWLNGEVAEARVDLTLLEIPAPFPTPSPSQKDLEEASTKQNVLTDRQKEDASKKADKWLKDNSKKLAENVSNLVKAKKYTLLITDTGVIELLDSNNRRLGVIGTYINGKFDTSNTNLIKSK